MSNIELLMRICFDPINENEPTWTPGERLFVQVCWPLVLCYENRINFLIGGFLLFKADTLKSS